MFNNLFSHMCLLVDPYPAEIIKNIPYFFISSINKCSLSKIIASDIKITF